MIDVDWGGVTTGVLIGVIVLLFIWVWYLDERLDFEKYKVSVHSNSSLDKDVEIFSLRRQIKELKKKNDGPIVSSIGHKDRFFACKHSCWMQTISKLPPCQRQNYL